LGQRPKKSAASFLELFRLPRPLLSCALDAVETTDGAEGSGSGWPMEPSCRGTFLAGWSHSKSSLQSEASGSSPAFFKRRWDVDRFTSKPAAPASTCWAFFVRRLDLASPGLAEPALALAFSLSGASRPWPTSITVEGRFCTAAEAAEAAEAGEAGEVEAASEAEATEAAETAEAAESEESSLATLLALLAFPLAVLFART